MEKPSCICRSYCDWQSHDKHVQKNQANIWPTSTKQMNWTPSALFLPFFSQVTDEQVCMNVMPSSNNIIIVFYDDGHNQTMTCSFFSWARVGFYERETKTGGGVWVRFEIHYKIDCLRKRPFFVPSWIWEYQIGSRAFSREIKGG